MNVHRDSGYVPSTGVLLTATMFEEYSLTMSRKRTTLPTILNSKSDVSDWYRVLFPWKRLTAKSKSGHCSQEQNAAPNTVTHNSKYTNYTLYFVFTEIKKIIRGHSLGFAVHFGMSSSNGHFFPSLSFVFLLSAKLYTGKI